MELTLEQGYKATKETVSFLKDLAAEKNQKSFWGGDAKNQLEIAAKLQELINIFDEGCAPVLWDSKVKGACFQG